MFDLFDFVAFLRVRRSVLRGGEARIRELVEDPDFEAWKYNFTETILAGLPAAILLFVLSSVFFGSESLYAEDGEADIEAVAMGYASAINGWWLPLSTFVLAFVISFLFAGTMGTARGRYDYARRAYLIAEGSYGLVPQAMVLAGLILVMMSLRVVEGWEMSLEEVMGLDRWSRAVATLAALFVVGAALLVIGLPLSIWQGWVAVPIKVARLCGHAAGAGLRRRVVLHLALGTIASAFIAFAIFGAAMLLAYLFAGAVELAREWLRG